ncbi:trbC/VIRB2 family protein [Candidatus Neoehrlichia lotoris str. RAC413]|uniref:TrbC/VIRB2 family protein n=2 Tax=Candidatus Neoehrlichia procyonis TaxID=467750 RepID=A0A0F3NRF3_9RICK|nr:TrbC/VirB2 family protein [Candidatus Neoehrlichia lotoris]KJV69489.1 trbC/VIRB2 family protein [Candidatus Neoehrlichia lotoris str. RAC413]
MFNVKILGMTFIISLIFMLCTGFFTVANANTAKDSETVTQQVICNVILFVQKLGLPIMTGVIVGSSIMAIFGRLAWPAIVMLVVFTAIFFGAAKLINKFAAGIGIEAENFECKSA